MVTSPRRLLLLPALVLCLPAGAAGAGSAAVPPSAVAPSRLERLSRAYLGTPYRLDCLGEGKGPDADPLFTRKAVDCQTLVEQVLAEALAPWSGGLDPSVRTIRYHAATPRLENRYHYCIPDWLENPWPATDITAALARKDAVTARRRIDRPTFLASRGGQPQLSPRPVQAVATPVLPRARIAEAESRIPDGSIGVFVLSRPGIVAGHLGFLFRKDGRVFFRHASQRAKKVIDEPLLAYVARAPRSFIGMKVLQPDVAGLRR